MTAPPPSADKPWDAEHAIADGTAAQVIAEQFPELAGRPLVHLGRGWDVEVWRVDDHLFRFPRRPLGVECLQNELRCLPYLATVLPTAVPTPSHRGKPSPHFPYPFYGHPMIEGTTADDVALDAEARTRLAPQLATFLARLHHQDRDTAGRHGIEADRLGRANMRRIREIFLPRLDLVPPGPWRDRLAPARALFEQDYPDGDPTRHTVVHGDLYARHLVLDSHLNLAGVIDWGDVCITDPAVDLIVAYSFLPPEARPAFWRVYGEVDAATRRRARVLALARHGLSTLLYGLDVGDTAMIGLAERTIVFTLADAGDDNSGS